MLPEIINSPQRTRSPFLRQPEIYSDLQRAVNRLMQDFIGDSSPLGMPLLDWSSAVDVSFVPTIGLEETDDKITLSAELPGMEEKDVEVQIERDFLIVRGEKREEKSSQAAGRAFNERRFGSFERTIRLPAEVEKNKISAKFKNGLLTVSMPKSAEAKKEIKKISIEH